MEGIMVLVGLYLIFRAFAKKGRSVLSSVQRQIGASLDGGAETTPPMSETPKVQTTAPFTTQQKLAAQRKQTEEYKLPTQRLEGLQRQRLQTTLRPDAIRDAYTGSLSAPSGEGRPSQEGKASLEGTDTSDPALERSLAVTPGLSSVGAGQSPILPTVWDGSELTRAFVLTEILGKSGKWSDYHG
mgnify:CR=1 FL=1